MDTKRSMFMACFILSYGKLPNVVYFCNACLIRLLGFSLHAELHTVVCSTQVRVDDISLISDSPHIDAFEADPGCTVHGIERSCLGG